MGKKIERLITDGTGRFIVFCLGLGLVLAFTPASALAQDCSSFDPADWPASSRPYFMLVVDTSGSMLGCTNPSTAAYQFPNSCPSTAPRNSCGMEPTRVNDAKCALRQTVQAFAGQVNFGLAVFPVTLSGCSPGTCADSCTANNGNCSPPSGVSTSGEYYPGSGCSVSGFQDWVGAASCGNRPSCSSGAVPPSPNYPNNWLNGANIVEPLLQDPTWGGFTPVSNAGEILKWFDGDCAESKELFAIGGTPIAGALTSIHQYLISGWDSDWDDDTYCAAGLSFTDETPMDAQDRACRTLHIILVTDGAHSTVCGGTPSTVAATLFNTGVTFGGHYFPIQTHVIGFAGVSAADVNPIADAGDDGLINGSTTALTAANEVSLAQALSSIIASSIAPEVCDNEDNNCNGCTDEGFGHYCNEGLACCTWSTEVQRQTCLTSYEASLATNPPNGDIDLLPCTDSTDATDSSTWLCYDPEEICDGIDNNCDGQIDEGTLRCGDPLHCPTTEVCNGQDDDCDGFIDEGGVCGTCVPSPEVCNGCDDDCDGIIDNPPVGGFPSLSCGLPSPANCSGTMACEASQPAAQPGSCAAGAGYVTCTNNPQAEVCDGIDNNCDGLIDNGLASSTCEPAGNAPGLDYGPNSQCTMGVLTCTGASGWVCMGGTGPSAEVCDGIDNDCNGSVDDGAFGVGQTCGNNTSPCTPGTTQCINGALVCVGGNLPQPEVCDGIDNNCNGVVDEAPLADAPLSGANGCWNEPGNCCVFEGKQWCPPAGATCATTGSLSAPCHSGTLTCDGLNGWICSGDVVPSAEVCDGVDNNCNGQVDETVDGSPLNNVCYTPGYGLDTGCTSDASCLGECQVGLQTCGALNPGVWSDCVGEVTPTNEVCDGLDNDCDGETDELSDMPWIGQPCPGACNGVWHCTNGVQECLGGTMAEGRCNGLDDDCDGVADELDELQQDPMYGQTCGTGDGECAVGNYECIGGGWICVGEVGPSEEVCDGLDNDCDGLVDWNAECPTVNQVDYFCLEGSCRPECDPVMEFPCPGDQDCVETDVNGTSQWVCMPKTGGECGNETCPLGWNCVDEICVDPCESVECDTWEECRGGSCVDVSCSGLGDSCGHDEFCLDHQCIVDPCVAMECGDQEEYCVRTCTESSCEARCETLCLCSPGEYCDTTGACVVDLCLESNCESSERCNPLDGSCETDNCQSAICQSGDICFDGTCVGDPCANILCPTGFSCIIRSDFSGSDVSMIAGCEGDAGFWVDGDEGSTMTGSGGTAWGCSASNSGGREGSLAWLSMLGLLFAALLRRRTMGGVK